MKSGKKKWRDGPSRAHGRSREPCWDVSPRATAGHLRTCHPRQHHFVDPVLRMSASDVLLAASNIVLFVRDT